VRVLITAGPTREPIDPVRFLSNHSTGAMGFALARAALERGHEPVLVLGPTEEQPPVGVDVVAVETALEMRDAVLGLLPEVGALLCAAAVCDYRAKAPSAAKIKRAGPLTLDLVENPDIAAEAGARRGERPLAVFALETGDGLANARAKLERKNATVCVLNGPEAVGADEAAFTLVLRDGTARELGVVPKEVLARALLDELGL
jgi:phosphopantothenoylcysteine decarboxylase/phosphopantothenate--cysteine ligase